MFCALFIASWLCFPPMPIVCEPIIYERNKTHSEKTDYNLSATFTAYNLEASQTDGAPCIGAGNHNLCDISKETPSKCIVATRLFDLHTIIEAEGIGECEVLDRTSKKYADRIDLLFASREEAIKFGKKEIKYRVIK